MAHTSAFGIYESSSAAQLALEALHKAGFGANDISVLMPDDESTPGGAIVGESIGLLAGIGALAIPGIGPFIAAGPIMGALAGAGVGSGARGLIGALVGMGIPEFEAKRYDGAIRSGKVLVAVHGSHGETHRATELLKSTGAGDITELHSSEVHGRQRADMEGDPTTLPPPPRRD